MWKDYSQDYVLEAWKNSKKKIEFMKKIDINNKDYRACKRAEKFFQLNEEDFGSSLYVQLRRPNRDVIGKKFGKIEVISINEPKSLRHHRTYYNCLCHECGEMCVKRIDSLNEKIKDCGCVSKIKNRLKNIIDITGNQYGSLKVLELDKEKTLINSNQNYKIYWKCECCRCKKIVSVLGQSLKSGNTRTCGCSRHDASKLRKDMTGQIFGLLEFIEPDEEVTLKRRQLNGDTSLWWKCKCLGCGQIVTINGGEVREGKVISYGCSKRSRGELLIKNFLDKSNIFYEEQYCFPDLKGEVRTLKFDFAIFKDNKIFTVIEFQGEQHYIAKDFFGGVEQLKKQKDYDQRKRNYCENKNINLIEIPFYKIDNIDTILKKELSEVILCQSAMCS